MTMWKPTIEGRSSPLYLAIADAIADGIGRGELAGGDRLPPHRNLAYDLGVTVGTVTRAYREAERRGLVAGEVGRGTFVKRPSEGEEWPLFAIPHEEQPQGIDLSLNYPTSPQNNSLYAKLPQALTASLLDSSLFGYQPAAGNMRHRIAAARLMSHNGLPEIAERVVICAGAQHGMTVVLASLCQPDDVVLTERLTYPGISAVTAFLHLRLRGVAIDDEGIIPEALDEACRKGGVRALYCMPTYHNPTTAVMSEERRAAIAEVARKHGIYIVEDDVYGFLHDAHPKPLANHAPERTFYITSASKCMMPSMRTGFIVAPEGFVDPVAGAVRTTTWMAGPIAAELMARWVEDGTAAEMIDWHRDESRARLDIAKRILRDQSFRSLPGSYHIWLSLPSAKTADQVVEAAQIRGVRLISSVPFTVGGDPAPHALRLCLGSPERRQDLEKALGVVEEILRRPYSLPFNVV